MAYEIQASDSLITPQEVVKYSPVDVHSHGEMRTDMIVTIEERLFRKCFGFDLYLDMLDNRKPYTLGPDYTHFQENINYTLNSYVLYKDELFKVIKVTTGKEVPPLKTHFKEAEKFENAKYDLFWKRYLRRILSFSVNTDSMMFRTVKDSADGIVRKSSEDYKGVTTKEVATVRKDYREMIDEMIENARQYILSNPDDFPLSKFVTEGCASNKCETKKVRHHGFNTNRENTVRRY